MTNSLGMKLVRIRGGRFLMGSADTDKQAAADQKPRHEVRITRDFDLGQVEVTIGQFRRFVTEDKYQTDGEKDGKGGWGYNEGKQDFEGSNPQYTWRHPGWAQSDDHPVVNVSWSDAKAFCRWLSRKESRQYRLPTEAEWEYCCRASSQTHYHTGDDTASLQRAANVADLSLRGRNPVCSWNAGWDDGFPFTAPVGKFEANLFGLHDMHGNVWEWCEDWYNANYYKMSTLEDPLGPATGSERVERGGSFRGAIGQCRSARRASDGPAHSDCFLGFRIVRVR
jgi:formylglycine-generating enzyme required for sulfatase activity